MKLRYITFIICFVLSAATGYGQTDSFMVDGVYRNYTVHLPTGYSAAAAHPLVLNLHGYTSDASQQELYTQMNTSADAHNYIVVYPNGISSYWNSWGPPGGSFGANDIKFLTELIDTLSGRYNVNPKRIYSCGMSNGGYMTYSLACAITDRLAAVASVAGTMSTYTYSTCHPSRHIPVMHIHGTSDNTVPYGTGATGSIGVEQTIAYWRDTNVCQHTTDTTNLPDVSTADGCIVQTIHYPYCAGGNDILLYKIANGGHTWPGGLVNIPAFGNTDRDISATEEIWKFFDRYTLDGPVSGVEEVHALSFAAYPDPATSIIHLSGVTDIAELNIYDITGQRMMQQTNADLINVSALSSGIYTLHVRDTKGLTGVIKFVKQ